MALVQLIFPVIFIPQFYNNVECISFFHFTQDPPPVRDIALMSRYIVHNSGNTSILVTFYFYQEIGFKNIQVPIKYMPTWYFIKKCLFKKVLFFATRLNYLYYLRKIKCLKLCVQNAYNILRLIFYIKRMSVHCLFSLST